MKQKQKFPTLYFIHNCFLNKCIESDFCDMKEIRIVILGPLSNIMCSIYQLLGHFYE